MVRNFNKKIGVAILTSGLAGMVTVPAAIPGGIPPFSANCELTIKQLKSTGEVMESNQVSAVFSSSNEWWRVDVRTSSVQKSPLGDTPPSTSSCMSVPGGIRQFTVFDGNTNKGLATARVAPLAFPPPGLMKLFVPWLGLCPHPQLPIINEKQMHRFLLVLASESDLLKHERNVGTYETAYLETQKAFLEKLRIKNNGLNIGMGQEITSFPPPFENGFTEFSYAVTETTNVGGITYPRKSIFQQYGRKPRAKNQDDLYVSIYVEMLVTHIDLQPDPTPAFGVTATRFFAIDTRPADLPTGKSVGYSVTSDVWKPPTDAKIVELVNIAKAVGKREAVPPKQRIWATLWMILMADAAVFLLGHAPTLKQHSPFIVSQ